MKSYASVPAYIAAAAPQARPRLRQLRALVRKAAPKAEEAISYGMPVYRLGGNLVYFGAFRDHIGFFPTASGIAAFARELAGFTTSKGTLQLPLDRPLPLGLIRKIVRFRVREASQQSPIRRASGKPSRRRGSPKAR